MNTLIRLALKHRLVVVFLAAAMLVFGTKIMVDLPIDIFPNLTRPRVTIMTESLGLSPEEVETLISIPIETAVNGASGVEAVRSTSGVGLSVVYVEFGWREDIFRARQIVNERLATVVDRLPEGVKPEIAPISSVMGQIMMIGVTSRGEVTPPMQVRTLSDWTIRQRLLTIPGVAQVITMGGGRQQYQVLVDPHQLSSFGVSLEEVTAALSHSNQNATGGYSEQGPLEFLVRSIGRIQKLSDIEQTVVKAGEQRSILVRDVATVRVAPQLKRGDCSVNGEAAVVLTIAKQPNADTRQLTTAILAALKELQQTLPSDIELHTDLFQQRDFIDRGVENVVAALRDGAILVVIVLFVFLLNLRITFITLTAIPLSVVMTGVVFSLTGMSINVMTLGGLAVAMGELVDDAIVDIENVFRRLGQNAALPVPRPKLQVIYEASLEVRGAIVFGTLIIILVFLPLFALTGVEGRLFAPLAVAYIVSILSSLLVSLTVTPVLGSLLLSDRMPLGHGARDPVVLRGLKWLAAPIVKSSLHPIGLSVILTVVFAGFIVSGVLVTQLGTDFLPAFDEGAAQVNVVLPPGTSLETSNRVSQLVDAAFQKHRTTPETPTALITNWVRRSGRAELDEHAEGVNVTEFVVSLNPKNELSRRDALALLRSELEVIPGIEYEVEQPLAHLISHMLSGVSAQIAIKVYGDDLQELRRTAQDIKTAITGIPGLAPPVVEPQQLIPQLLITLDREQLAAHGLSVGEINQFLETALHGATVTTIVDGQRTFDLVVKLEDRYRYDFDNLRRLQLPTADGSMIPLESVARIMEGAGPNSISRERVRRRITIRGNTTDRDLGTVVADIQAAIREKVRLPAGGFVEYGGQFEAQQTATSQILMLGFVSLIGVFLLLYSLFPSVRIVLQIMFALPTAFIGGVLALWMTQQSLSVASLVGFISLAGISARNGILLVAHYRQLMQHEGEGFTPQMVMRGSLERLAPVLMTAVTAIIGLFPLVLGGHQPGKEILYPVATVIVGGLVTSTICEYLVHPGLFFRFSGASVRRFMEASQAKETP